MRLGFQPSALPTELNPVDCSTGIEPVIPGSRPGVLPLNEPQSAVSWIRTREYELMRLMENASSLNGRDGDYYSALSVKGVRR